MKRSRFNEEEVIGILREGAGVRSRRLCARHNISEATYYAWKRSFFAAPVKLCCSATLAK
jgi:putative transposase